MIKKLVTYYCFIVVTATVLLGFLNATTYPQLLSAVLFFPLAMYFWFAVIPTKNKALVLPEIKVKSPVETKVKLVQGEKSKGPDADRRAFLKLVGSAGISLFLLSIVTKKAHAAFFGSVPGPGTVGVKDASGNLINPAEKQPTDGYKISRLDDSGNTSYYGFTNKDGDWFVMKDDGSGNYTYAVGSGDFDTIHWANRVNLSYGEYFAKF